MRKPGPPATGAQSRALALGCENATPSARVNAELLPSGIGSRGAAMHARRRAHLETPMLAAPVIATVNEIARRGCERVVGRPIGRSLAIVIVVDAHMQLDFGHPLGVA